MARTPKTDPDADLLAEIRENFTYATNQWADIREAAKDDMRVVGGDPWDPKDRKAREDAGRVCLSLDELHQYFNQLINDVRSNPRAPKFDPAGNGASDQTAQFYGDKMREIEYRSQAQIAYTTAFQNAVHQGYGWLKFTTKFAPKAFVQDLWIEEIPNPDLIIGDPDALRPSSSDMKHLFELQSLSVKEFRRAFPDAQVTSFTPEIISQAPAWISAERVQVAQYWTVEPTAKPLYLLKLQDGSTQSFYEDELAQMPPGAIVLDQRTDEVPEVCMYLTNGVEILKRPGQKEKKVRWAGRYIPYVSCFGMVIYVDEGSGPKRKILSMTRLARDPYMLYCYYRTCQAELVGMTPKIPYFVRRGSLKPDQLANLQKSLHEPIAVIEVEAFVEGMPGGTPEFPQRNPFSPEIQVLEIGAEGARRAIQAAMGISPLPTQAQRRNEKSGIALQQIESSQQKGSFHFIDHYEALLQHAGVIAEDLLDKVYDTEREVGIRNAKGEAKTVTINTPAPKSQDDLPSIKGDHTVTVSTGPAFESQRQEGAAFTDTLVSNLQMIAATAGPKPAAAMLGLAIKLKNLGELGDEMAKIVTPPEYAQNGQPPQIPPEVQQQIQQMQGQMQQLQELADKNKTELMKADLQAKTDLQGKQLQEAAETDRLRMKLAAEIEVARISAAKEAANQAAEAFEERLALSLDHAHDAATQAVDQAHEQQLSAQEHQQALAQADQGHQQALEQGAQQADTQSQLQAQQQAAQPPAEGQ